MDDLSTVAPAFVDIAHRIVWCTVATTDTAGVPRTRVLHPVWEWDGTALTGWIATDPNSLKRRHLDRVPHVALTYWDQTQDTASAVCGIAWELDDEDRRRGWQRFVEAPAPVGYDPAIIPGWTSPEAASFGILRLEPTRLSVMPGSVLMRGEGRPLAWAAPSSP